LQVSFECARIKATTETAAKTMHPQAHKQTLYSVARSLQNNDQKDIPLKDYRKAPSAFAFISMARSELTCRSLPWFTNNDKVSLV
jgi:hypothetical protein